ncbi:expressed unknown protein [Seminavis robusta]|uniref:Uncharacterized protein n=1 Tax=Seminavis robusta TaxID=568900 RepID=A0A9N8EVC7_9STRA|nr:expressed unknown protein [Seminavis robusta]|eukprot:Sro1934_g306290.1 n/a (245) ;mRNA; f:3639-4373
MWKPGTAKPKNKNKRKSPSRSNSQGSGQPSAPAKDNKKKDNVPDTGPTAEASAAASQKKLSGALMNMKFMKRTSNRRQPQQPTKETPKTQETKTTPDNDDDPMEVDTAPIVAHSPLVVQRQHQQQQSIPHEQLLVDATATNTDMYGLSVAVIGRRSFGGFNRPVEASWKASYRAHKEGIIDTNSNNNNDAKASDEELLKRYANLVKQRDNAGRKPVGNLQEKVKPRKKMQSPNNNKGGEKRKRR